jgi:hypothetical protein
VKRWIPSLKAEFQTNTGSVEENQWLRDSGVEGRARGSEGVHQPDVNHKLYGRVKIGRNVNTKMLTFTKYTSASSSSNEWVTFDPLIVPTGAEFPEPRQQQQNLSFQSIAGSQNEGSSRETEEARIARLIQEARLRNPLMIDAAQMHSTPISSVLTPIPPISQLYATLSKVVQVGSKLSSVKPKIGKGKTNNKGADQKALKHLRVEESNAAPQYNSEVMVQQAESPTQNTTEGVADAEVVMQDTETDENNVVMAEPDSQARQEK